MTFGATAVRIEQEAKFLRDARMVAFYSTEDRNRLYARLKESFELRFPDHDQAQYERIVRQLAAIAGV